jgi:hypothetical protein
MGGLVREVASEAISSGAPPNQRLLLTGPAASTFELEAAAGGGRSPQQKRDPLGSLPERTFETFSCENS